MRAPVGAKNHLIFKEKEGPDSFSQLDGTVGLEVMFEMCDDHKFKVDFLCVECRWRQKRKKTTNNK